MIANFSAITNADEVSAPIRVIREDSGFLLSRARGGARNILNADDREFQRGSRILLKNSRPFARTRVSCCHERVAGHATF
jgi:hypothetical protein